MRMRETSARAFAWAMAPTVLPLRAAMWLTVSPDRTVYCSSAWAAPAVAVAAAATSASAPVPVATRRSPTERAAADWDMAAPRVAEVNESFLM